MRLFYKIQVGEGDLSSRSKRKYVGTGVPNGLYCTIDGTCHCEPVRTLAWQSVLILLFYRKQLFQILALFGSQLVVCVGVA